jgi:UPF0176 protein
MYEVILFYKYVTIADPEAYRVLVRTLAEKHELLGRVLIAEEGINGTLEGTKEHTDAFGEELRMLPELSDLKIKTSAGNGEAFKKLYIKVRDEIVGTRFPKDVDPRIQTGKHLTPEELKNWYTSGKDFKIIDMRNDYEYQSGHFKDSINPGMDASRELPDMMDKLEPLKDQTVLTVCTGGVRCEKMSAYLLAKGFKDVYQLEEGMHAYMEKYPGEDFLGTLYTFDKRLTMDFGGEREIVGACRMCTAKTEEYINCGNDFCHRHFLVCKDCKGEEKTFCSEECVNYVPAEHSRTGR